MKRILIAILFLSLYLNVNAWQFDAELGVLAIGFVVSDIEASEKFYTDIIGMVLAGQFSLDNLWSEEAGAANDKPFSVKMFKMKNRASATILKLAYFEKTKKQKTKKGIDVSSGVNYLTFSYDDLTSVLTRVENAGINIIGDVKRDNYRIIFIRDPDGVFIELIERL
ncbi:MAG: catechol 2,3-dioxygenase-like lactoylglutathione lyase family enzyme [Roseivirga sp.]|jgi:catechol 2,3-dioxygenase-like lactoylglutathione lyase family enzyme